MARILVVDDKDMMRDSIGATLSRNGHTVAGAPGGRAALAKVAERPPDCMITDLQMPDMTGLELLEEVRRLDEQLPVILITAYGTIETAVTAMKIGAFDYITKPFSGDELLVAVNRAVEHAMVVKENQILRANLRTAGRLESLVHTMVGNGRAMSELRERLSMIADSHGTVLVTGESGTGKEVAANWIHAHSPRADKPFLAINCAALSTSLLESELFGHEKGAFTGADKLRKGRFELADGGTLLLDEISEIAPAIQAKLLRVLQERAFERVGSSASRKVDVRVIATSNRNLVSEVRKGTFREDLYFRLNVLPVEMPPLRHRIEDVPDLVSHFLKIVAQREGRPMKQITRHVIDVFQGYHWPGNVRECQNICERAAVLTVGPSIESCLVEPWLAWPRVVAAQPSNSSASAPASVTVEPKSMLPRDLGEGAATSIHEFLTCNGEQTLEAIEREAILATLDRFSGHRQRSAKALGIGVRTLGLKLKKWKDENKIPESV